MTRYDPLADDPNNYDMLNEEETQEDDDDDNYNNYCGACAGSGEGMYDGSRCSSCKGSGHHNRL